MRVVSLDEGWHDYLMTATRQETRHPPPPKPSEGIMVYEGSSFAGGMLLVPCGDRAVLAGDIYISELPDLELDEWPSRAAVIAFMFSVLRGHAKVTGRLALISAHESVVSLMSLRNANLWVLPMEWQKPEEPESAEEPEASEEPKDTNKKRPAVKKATKKKPRAKRKAKK